MLLWAFHLSVIHWLISAAMWWAPAVSQAPGEAYTWTLPPPGGMWSFRRERTSSPTMNASWLRETLEGVHKLLKFEKKVVSSGQPEEEGDVQGALRVLPHYTLERALSLPAFTCLSFPDRLCSTRQNSACLRIPRVSLPIPRQMLTK